MRPKKKVGQKVPKKVQRGSPLYSKKDQYLYLVQRCSEPTSRNISELSVLFIVFFAFLLICVLNLKTHYQKGNQANIENSAIV